MSLKCLVFSSEGGDGLSCSLGSGGASINVELDILNSTSVVIDFALDVMENSGDGSVLLRKRLIGRFESSLVVFNLLGGFNLNSEFSL